MLVMAGAAVPLWVLIERLSGTAIHGDVIQPDFGTAVRTLHDIQETEVIKRRPIASMGGIQLADSRIAANSGGHDALAMISQRIICESPLKALIARIADQVPASGLRIGD